MTFWDIKTLKKNIEKFRHETFKSDDVSQVVKKLQSFYNCYNIMTSKVGNLPVFRVRKIEKGESHNKVESVWSPPSRIIDRIGRANDIGESIMYVACDPITAILEGRIEENDEFSLAVYFFKVNNDLNLSSIVINTPIKGVLQDRELDDYSIELSKFMVEEFTKSVKKGNEWEYKKSCAMAKILFELPNIDSIIYPSIRNYNKTNIALIEKKARKRLELGAVLKCHLKRKNDNNALDITILGYANVSPEDVELHYENERHSLTITSNTWVKKEMNFRDVFSNIKLQDQK